MELVQHETPLRRGMSLAALQLALVAGLLWVLFTAEHDATATSVDWAGVTFMIAMPLALSVSYWAGRSINKPTSRDESRVVRLVIRIAQGATLALLVPSVLFAPIGVLVSVFIEPIG